MATAAIPAPARLATAAPVYVGSEKLPVVALALAKFVADAVGTMMLLPAALPEDSAALNAVAMVVGVARATLCSDNTEATPPADVATLGMPVTMPSELVMVV